MALLNSTTSADLNPNFFVQLIQRLFSQKPWFFSVLQVIVLILGIVSKVLEYLQVTSTDLPSWLSWLPSATTQVGAVVAILVAQLPVKPPVPTPTTN